MYQHEDTLSSGVVILDILLLNNSHAYHKNYRRILNVLGFIQFMENPTGVKTNACH